MKKAFKKNKNREKAKPAKPLMAGTVSKEIVNSDRRPAPPAKCDCPPGCAGLACCS
jgi:hypothetical protein